MRWAEIRRGTAALLWSVAAWFVTAAPASGQVKLTTAKALELAFPGCAVERRPLTLDPAQRAAIGRLSGQEYAGSMVFAYIARRADKVVGTAWFDVHQVRSKRQLLMVVVAPTQTVQRVEVLAFAEPRRYAAPRRWLDKLHDRRLGQLRPGREVPRITGATLTVRATTRCVERVLAVHRVVFGAPVKAETRRVGEPPGPRPRTTSRPVTPGPSKQGGKR